MKMSEETKKRLKKYSSNKECVNCGSKKTYTNPFYTCYECKKKFCGICINAGMVTEEMEENEPARDVCKKCSDKYGYIDLEDWGKLKREKAGEIKGDEE